MDLQTIDTIISIDVGAGGGIAIWRDGKITIVNMPKSLDDLNKFFAYWVEISKNPICFIEHVNMYLSDSKDGKQFGIVKMLDNYSNLKSMLTVNNIPFLPVYAITWQTKLKLKIKGEEKPERKRRYKKIAQKENPGLKVTLKTCDALLILKFGRIMLQNDKKWILDKLQINKSLF